MFKCPALNSMGIVRARLPPSSIKRGLSCKKSTCTYSHTYQKHRRQNRSSHPFFFRTQIFKAAIAPPLSTPAPHLLVGFVEAIHQRRDQVPALHAQRLAPRHIRLAVVLGCRPRALRQGHPAAPIRRARRPSLRSGVRTRRWAVSPDPTARRFREALSRRGLTRGAPPAVWRARSRCPP